MGEVGCRIILFLHGFENGDKVVNALSRRKAEEDRIGWRRIRAYRCEGEDRIPSGRGQNVNVHIPGADLNSVFIQVDY